MKEYQNIFSKRTSVHLCFLYLAIMYFKRFFYKILDIKEIYLKLKKDVGMEI